jgi:hypothetical protein
MNNDPAAEVVLQVRANAHKLMAWLHTGSAQPVGIADTGQHEQLRGFHCAAAEDDLTGDGHSLAHAGRIPVLHASGTGTLEQNPLGVGLGKDGQVGASHGGTQVGVRGAVPQPAMLGDRGRRISGVVRLVEFAETPQAQLSTGGQER